MPTPDELADQLQQAVAGAIAFAETCTEEQWRTPVPGEDWTVGVLVHHVALGNDLVCGWIDRALSGRPIEVTGEEIDAANAQHAEDFAAVSMMETVEVLGLKGAAAASRIRSLTESDLATTTPFGPADDRTFSVESFCNVAARHVENHIGHARAALGQD